jgi:UDP-N-acetylglucosamine 2-epimerase (non-hydrolysing)
VSPSVVHVIGARPNFPKAAPVLDALDEAGFKQRLVHTGQHYDRSMSGVFLEELGMRTPDLNLGIGSGTQVGQMSAIMSELENSWDAERPDLVIVYGDVTSTIAAAITAAKMGINIAHVEAGLRSYDRSMPEELNRIVTDQLSNLLFVTSADAVGNLKKEGVFGGHVHFVGNTMIDSLLRSINSIKRRHLENREGLPAEYAVVTVHRPSNVDSDTDASEVANLLNDLSALIPVVVPLHPRGRARLESFGLNSTSRLKVLEPQGYIDFLALVYGSRLVVTDSGGVQEETTALGVPCFTLRPNTERPITITSGTNMLVNRQTLLGFVQTSLSSGMTRPHQTPDLWDGRASERVAVVLKKFFAE